MKEQLLIVTAPVADVRKEPVGTISGYACGDLRETQVFYNEILLCRDESDDWYYVETTEQKKMTSRNDWQGYPGWIQKTFVAPLDTVPSFNAVVKRAETIVSTGPHETAGSFFALSIGTRLAVEKEEVNSCYETVLVDGKSGRIKKDDINMHGPVPDRKLLREYIVETARQFLGMPYLWGGRSGCGKGQEGTRSGKGGMQKTHDFRAVARGVDCSGLTNLAYRVNMIDIPRDACDQWRVFAPVVFDALKPADLIFISAAETYDRIVHVVMYLGGEEFIEAVETGSCVSINTFKNKYGLTLRETAEQGYIVDKRKMYFGSMLTGSGEQWVL